MGWMGEQTFQETYGRYGMAHVQALLEREHSFIKVRRNPDCPRRKQYFVQHEEDLLASFPCLPLQNGTDTEVWMSYETFRNKFWEYGPIDSLRKRGLVDVRHDPNCPRQKQY